MSESLTLLGGTLEVLLRFGAMMLRAGDTAFRVSDSMKSLASRLGVESLSIQIALDGMTATARRDDELVTITSEIGPPGINAWRISALEKLAREGGTGLTARTLADKLDAIEAARRCGRSRRWRSRSALPRAPSPS